MPRGRYRLHDPQDRTPLGEERFHCAPGPTGWRYVATRHAPDGRQTGSLDIALDALGRPLRMALRAGDWQIRGGALDGLSWVRTDHAGEHAQPGSAAAHAFSGSSPAFLVAVARLLRPGPDAGATRVRLVEFTDPALAPRTLDRSWRLLGSEDHQSEDGTVTVHTYRVTDLESGEASTVHLSGDIVLDAPGTELEDLDAPPSAFDTLP